MLFYYLPTYPTHYEQTSYYYRNRLRRPGSGRPAGSQKATRLKCLRKRDKPGGRGYVYEINGFTFDGGPTVDNGAFLCSMNCSKLAEKKREDYIEFVPCNPFYRIFDDKGRVFDYNDNEEFTLGEIDKFNPDDQSRLPRIHQDYQTHL